MECCLLLRCVRCAPVHSLDLAPGSRSIRRLLPAGWSMDWGCLRGSCVGSPNFDRWKNCTYIQYFDRRSCLVQGGHQYDRGPWGVLHVSPRPCACAALAIPPRPARMCSPYRIGSRCDFQRPASLTTRILIRVDVLKKAACAFWVVRHVDRAQLEGRVLFMSKLAS
jgi:hypothetical protein